MSEKSFSRRLEVLLPPSNEVCEGYVFTHVCLSTEGGWWYPSMPCSRSPGGGIPACLAGFQAHTQGGSWGDLARGISRSTPKGKLRGSGQGGLQAHTQGEVEGDLARGVSRPTPKGKLRGIWPGGSPGLHPRGKLRRIWPGGSQVHTQGGRWGGSGQGGLQTHTQGDLQAHTRGVYPSMHWGRTPRQLLLRAVRILLECILVTK